MQVLIERVFTDPTLLWRRSMRISICVG